MMKHFIHKLASSFQWLSSMTENSDRTVFYSMRSSQEHLQEGNSLKDR